MRRIPVSGLCVIIGCATLVAAFIGSQQTARPVSGAARFAAGSEEPVAGVYANGFNVPDLGACRFGETYQREALLLGPPVSGFLGRTQSFAFGRLECRPDQPSNGQVSWSDLGLLALRGTGRVPVPGSDVPLVVQAHLAMFVEAQLNLDRYVGRALGTVCAVRRCRTYFDKQVLSFSERDWPVWASERVVAEPLGCLVTPACHQALIAATQPARVSRVTQPWRTALWVAGAGLVLGGGLLVVFCRSAVGRQFVTG